MKASKLISVLLLCALASPVLAQTAEPAAAAAPMVDSGNTSWLLVSTALVMLMTPGLAFFYAGMVSRKNVVSTLLQNFVALGVVGLLWIVVGYSLAFSDGNPYIGDMSFLMLKGLDGQLYGDAKVPHYAFMAFQMMFAVITPALITGAIAERVHFKAWLLLLALWSIFVYAPVAHWVWSSKGWIAALGGLDFAGGLVVHLTAGVAGLVAAIMFGKRNMGNEVNRPNDVSMIMLGAALLWFGWFGFNAGSAITSGFLAAHAFVTTFAGAAAAMLGWLLVDWIKNSKPSAVGAAIGLVVGLVIVTPAAGFVSVASAIFMCGVGSVICNTLGHLIKTKTHLDDTLDVFACHGIGGALGAIMTGMFATKLVNPAVAVDGILIGGQIGTLKANLIGVIAVAVFTAVVTYILIKIVNVITPIRVSETEETVGLDVSVHGEVSRFHDRRAQ
ncbi:MAG TPA: ammonium transporter [Rickettsiales bacterium]|nr:ammonium transporter [Rickettsiales bacterium]